MDIWNTIATLALPIVAALSAWVTKWLQDKKNEPLRKQVVLNGQIASWIAEAEMTGNNGETKENDVMQHIKKALGGTFKDNNEMLYFQSKIAFIVAQYNSFVKANRKVSNTTIDDLKDIMQVQAEQIKDLNKKIQIVEVQ